jgi:hypothetical protein
LKKLDTLFAECGNIIKSADVQRTSTSGTADMYDDAAEYTPGLVGPAGGHIFLSVTSLVSSNFMPVSASKLAPSSGTPAAVAPNGLVSPAPRSSAQPDRKNAQLQSPAPR